jgi:Holliday junction resolvase
LKYHVKVDSSQKQIVLELRKAGAIVKHVHSVKKLFDILVYYNSKTYSVEIKTDAKKKLTPGEQECKEDIESAGVKYWVITSVKEALKMIEL